MENSWYSFDLPFGWVASAWIAGLILAVVLYSKKGVPWTRNVSFLLGALRMSSIFLVILLLLNPLLNLSINHTQKSIIVYALDNSESIALRTNEAEQSVIKNWISTSLGELSNQYETVYKDLGNSDQDSIEFRSQETNLGALLQAIEASYEGENIGAVVLASDGIINKGALPQYNTYTFPVFTVGLGDTIAPKDLAIKEVRNNKIAYQGNKFPIRIELQQKGFAGTPVSLTIKEKGKTLAQESMTLSRPQHVFNLNLDANNAGLKHLVIEVTKLEDESSFVNNKKDVYINVIEGKDRVLILAPAPHPDISTIRQVLANAANYETTVYIPGVSKESVIEGKYDVIINHNAFKPVKYPEINANGTWFLVNNESASNMNDQLDFFNVLQRGRQTDNIRPVLQPSFSKFKLNPDNIKAIDSYPPLSVPFGEYGFSGPVEVLMTQRVGSLDTGKPLMLFYDDGSNKVAVTMGTGIWQWRMQESGFKETPALFDEIILKTVQFLSIKDDKKQFVVRPRQSTFNESERIFLDTEVYDEIYERRYGNKIRLNITNEADETKAFELVDNEMNAAFSLGRMNQGVYTYVASTTISGKTVTEKGEFIVNQTQVESLNLQADHQMLRQLASKTGGEFFDISETNSVSEKLKNADFKSIIRTEEELFPLINSLWVIGLIILLLSIEWFFRKYLGAY